MTKQSSSGEATKDKDLDTEFCISSIHFCLVLTALSLLAAERCPSSMMLNNSDGIIQIISSIWFLPAADLSIQFLFLFYF